MSLATIVRDPRLAPGAVFETHYEIEAPLGEGGFGAVYAVRQRSTGQKVALKIMRLPEGSSAAAAEKRAARFLRETRLCAQLHHPHIVQLIDSGRSGEGLLYSVFAFTPGEDLASLLAKEGALDPREARHLMLEVLDALTCAHAQGVVHRDLKPRNIMITSTGARRHAVVLDFGIGAFVGGRVEEGKEHITGTGEILGTPGYSAPEQARGLEPSPAADLFAWGLVFIECLTGKPVYRGDSTVDILFQLLGPGSVPIPPALERHPLGDLLRKTTRKDVATRAVTAPALLAELETCDFRGLMREALSGNDGASGGGTAQGRPAGPTATTLSPFARLPLIAPAAGEEERRQVTAVGCVLEAVAAPPGTADTEALDELLLATLAACADLARRHGGQAMMAMGDEALFYFGYPLAEEDDARRAARAALAMADAVRAESERLALERGVRLDARIGIHTGIVLARAQHAGSEVSLLVGATPRIATRIAVQARPGGILVTAGAQPLLRSAFDLAEDGTRSVHGLAEPLKVFELRRERASEVTPGSGDNAGAALVGRDREMGLLLERWSRTQVGGGQCSLVSGEPGIGKTRLVRELRDRSAGDARGLLEGRCSADAQNIALFPVVDMLARAFGMDQVSSPAARTARLQEQLARHGLRLEEAMPLFLPLFSLPVAAPYAPLDVAPTKQKELTLQSILSLLLTMAEEQPLLLLMEDLHWADPTTLDLLGRVAREAPSVPLCAVFTARPEYVPSFPAVGMLQLPLGRLERPQIEAMVAGLTGGKALPPAAIEQVVSRTDGVPLFVEELTRMMIDSGALSEAEIPGTLRALLTARLDRLGRAKETAQIAAALGREFNVQVLSAASLLGAEAVQEDLDRLGSAGLVFRRRRAADPSAVFKHALIRDAAYESLSMAARQKVHARIAATLEERFPATVEARPDLLARHHGAAEQYDRAVTYGLRATQMALTLAQNDEAIAHGTSTLEHISRRPAKTRASQELSLNGLLTPALMAKYGWGNDRVKAQVERSRHLLDEIGESEHRFPTLCSLVFYHHVAGNRRDARTLAKELFDTAMARGDLGEQVLARTLLGQCLWIDGDYIEGEKLLASAVDLYDPGTCREHGLKLGTDTRTWAAGSLGQLLWFAGDPIAARESIRRAVAWAEELKFIPTLGLVLMYDGLVCQYAGDKAGAEAATSRAIALADKYDLPAYNAYCNVIRFWALGDADSATPILKALDGMGSRLGLDYYTSLSAQTLMERGEHTRALERLEACIAMCAPMDQHYYEPELHLRAAACKLHLGSDHHEGARASLREAREMARRQGMHRSELDALVEEARHFGASEEQRRRMAEILVLRPHALDGEKLAFARALGISGGAGTNAV